MPASIRHLKQLFADEKAPIVLLSIWPENSLFYLVKLLKLDEKKGKCQVRYEDGTECFVSVQDVHMQLTGSIPDESEDIFCCLCDKGDSEEPSEVIMCDTCQQGYHRHCYATSIVDKPRLQQVQIGSSSDEWTCYTCEYIMTQLNSTTKTSTPKVKSRPKNESPRRAVLKKAQAKKSGIKLKLISKDNKIEKKPSQESTKIKPSQETTKIEQSQETAKIKQSQESTKTKRVAPAASKSEISDESAPGDSSDESRGSLLQGLPEDAVIDGEKSVLDTAITLVENIGTTAPTTITTTNDFVDAIAKTAEPKSKTKPTNGKPAKKVAATKKKSTKLAVPPPA